MKYGECCTFWTQQQELQQEVCRRTVVELSKYISCSIALNKNMMLFNKGIRLFVACQLFHLVNKSAAVAQVVCVVKKKALF
jgi:hypothetical protein